MTNNSHRDCVHPATKAGRAACRKNNQAGIRDFYADRSMRVAEALHRLFPEHSIACITSVVDSYLQNWYDSQIEDPTAEWCKGEPTDRAAMNAADMISGLCRCDELA